MNHTTRILGRRFENGLSISQKLILMDWLSHESSLTSKLPADKMPTSKLPTDQMLTSKLLTVKYVVGTPYPNLIILGYHLRNTKTEAAEGGYQEGVK
jgi:hypothetical protein